MGIQEILEDLKYNTGVFPRKALEDAVSMQEQITPLLLDIIRDAKSLPGVLREKNSMAHIYAMYLLAQFREQAAYPLMVDFFSVPDEIVMECMGDVVTEDLHRILASVAHGDTVLIKSLVENEQIDECVRGAALDTLVTQVVLGDSTRDQLMTYFESLFRGGLKKEPSSVWDELIWYSTDLYPQEVMADIQQAYAEGLVDPGCILLQDVHDGLALGKEVVLRRLHSDHRRRCIENVIEDISWWACFSPVKPTKSTGVKSLQSKAARVIQPEVGKRKVGRNDPCPCGSGKKYKKCCGK